MTSSRHRLSEAERRTTVDQVFSLLDLEAAYLQHHEAPCVGRSHDRRS